MIDMNRIMTLERSRLSMTIGYFSNCIWHPLDEFCKPRHISPTMRLVILKFLFCASSSGFYKDHGLQY